MAQRRVILVTGVAGFFGSRVAARLASIPELHVIGLDTRRPRAAIRNLDYIQADVRNPLLPQLFEGENIDTVCHLAFIESERPAEHAFDVNVMGTVKVLGACSDAGVRKVVLRSSTMVYGALPENSAFLTEEHALRASQSYGVSRDLVEIESYCNGFRHQMPEIVMTILRFANIIGPNVDSPITRFLRETWTPTLLGFDPMMQLIHEEDAIEALVYVVLNDVPGIFNVAADGPLPLSQLMAVAGKLPIPLFHLGVYWGRDLARAAGVNISQCLPIDPDYLRYSWVGDLAKMRERLGFTPRYAAIEAVREFAGYHRLSRFLPQKAALDYDEERLRDTIERRHRARMRKASGAPDEQAVANDGNDLLEDYEVEADDNR